MERRPLPDLAFSPDASAMTGDDAMHDGQTDAGAFELVVAVQPLKHAEQLLHVLHVEAPEDSVAVLMQFELLPLQAILLTGEFVDDGLAHPRQPAPEALRRA